MHSAILTLRTEPTLSFMTSFDMFYLILYPRSHQVNLLKGIFLNTLKLGKSVTACQWGCFRSFFFDSILNSHRKQGYRTKDQKQGRDTFQWSLWNSVPCRQSIPERSRNFKLYTQFSTLQNWVNWSWKHITEVLMHGYIWSYISPKTRFYSS